MYSAGYGGYGNAAPNFNNGAPQQQGGQPGQQQHQQQQQQMMYNQQQQQQQPQQQQFPGMGPQSGYPQGANAQMMAGMMQNPNMQQMAANGQSFQQQFAGNPYGQVPSSVMQQNFNPNAYMMAGGMQGFPMNQGGMPQQAQQQMMQRMQAQQQAQQQAQAQAQAQAHAQAQAQAQAQGTPGMTPGGTPQRPPSAAQGTPVPLPPQIGQYSTPQTPSQVPTPGPQQQQHQPPPQQPQQPQQQPPQLQQVQQAQQQQQPQSAGTATPQTPTFASNQGIPNGASSAVPLSPGTTAIESQRFALLLDINSELLYESIQIQASQQEIKKQRAKEASTGEKSQTDPAAQKAEDTMLQQDYLACMNRLKANLTYMAALADRKPDVKVPQSPQYLTAPNLNLTLKLRTPAETPDVKFDPADRESRAQSIRDLYSRLQAVFPGIDPKNPPRPQPPMQKPGVPVQGQPNPMPPAPGA